MRERGDLLEVFCRVGGVEQLRMALEQPGEARAVAQPGGAKDIRQGAVLYEQRRQLRAPLEGQGQGGDADDGAQAHAVAGNLPARRVTGGQVGIGARVQQAAQDLGPVAVHRDPEQALPVQAPALHEQGVGCQRLAHRSGAPPGHVLQGLLQAHGALVSHHTTALP